MGIKIELPGTPIALQRARTRGQEFYDPQYQVKQNTLWYFKKHYGTVHPMDFPLSIILTFHMPMPKKWSKKKKNEFLGKPHTKKKDIDNLCKYLFDTFNGILWIDDSLIWKISAKKIYAIEGLSVLEFEME